MNPECYHCGAKLGYGGGHSCAGTRRENEKARQTRIAINNPDAVYVAPPHVPSPDDAPQHKGRAKGSRRARKAARVDK